MSRNKEITRWLLAAGSTSAPHGKGTFHFYEQDNALSVMLWTGSEFGPTSWVAKDVKTNTSAPCVLMGGKAVVFCIDQSDTIKCYAEPPENQAGNDDDNDDDDDDGNDDVLWKEAPLAPASPVKVHPKGQLATIVGDTAITVFFQGTDGHLSSLVNQGQGWRVVDMLAGAEALPGTPLASFVSQGKTMLFYVGTDHSVHYLTYQDQGGSWADSRLASATFGPSEAPSRITVAESDGGLGFAVYCLTKEGRELALVKTSANEVDVLGTVAGGEFIAAKGQEAVFAGWAWRPVPVFVDWVPRFWTPW